MSTKTGRLMVTASPSEMFTAERHCRVEFWVPAIISAEQFDQDASVVFFSLREDECTVEQGTPVLFDSVIHVVLDAGETIWAVTSNMAYAGFVVEEL